MFSNKPEYLGKKEEEIQFEQIYAAAKDLDEVTLTKLAIRLNGKFSVYKGSFTPLMKLAVEGHDEAVELLLTKFEIKPDLRHAATSEVTGSRNEAVKGYAWAGNVEKVNLLLAAGGGKYSAILWLYTRRASFLH
jgi:hypothetical protein